jgi:hypothetical protein
MMKKKKKNKTKRKRMSERNLSRKSTMIMFRIFLNLLQVEPRNSIRELKQLREASRDKNLKLKLN